MITNFDNDGAYTHPLHYDSLGKDDYKSPIGIFLHGFGSSTENTLKVAEPLLSTVPYWIVPQAPIHLYKLFAHQGYGWFPSHHDDIIEALTGIYWGKMPALDPPEISIVTKKIINEFIIPIKKQNETRKIVLAGFSQGGMVSSETLIQCMLKHIAIHKTLLFSSCLLAQDRWNETITIYQKEHPHMSSSFPPLFQAHGELDIVLHYHSGQLLHKFWEQYTTVDFHKFIGGHEITPSIINNAARFLAS